MPNYQNTVIYRMPVGNKNYYGHSTQPLCKRKSQHKDFFNKYPNRKVYKAVRDAGMSADDIDLIWVEDYPCDNINQAKARERYWVECDGELNTTVPTRTFREWLDDHEGKREEYNKNRRDKWVNDEEYRKRLYERGQPKEKCDACGKQMRRWSINNHKKKHCIGTSNQVDCGGGCK